MRGYVRISPSVGVSASIWFWLLVWPFYAVFALTWNLIVLSVWVGVWTVKLFVLALIVAVDAISSLHGHLTRRASDQHGAAERIED